MRHYTSDSPREIPEGWNSLKENERSDYMSVAVDILKTEELLEKAIYSWNVSKENYFDKIKECSVSSALRNLKNDGEGKIKLQSEELSCLISDSVSKIKSLIEGLNFYKDAIYHLIDNDELLDFACFRTPKVEDSNASINETRDPLTDKSSLMYDEPKSFAKSIRKILRL